MDKYTLVDAAIEQALEGAAQQGIDSGEAIEALIVSAIQRSLSLRGEASTRQFLEFELSNLAGEVDLDFIRSR